MEEEVKEAMNLADELYSLLFTMSAPDGFLDDLDRIIYWLNDQ